VYPIPDPLLLRKSGSDGNRTRTSGSAARNSDLYTTEAVSKSQMFGNVERFTTTLFDLLQKFIDTTVRRIDQLVQWYSTFL
jgi:hypothetical protein